MPLDLQQTIVALSSAVAPSTRAIVRISGCKTATILHQLLCPETASEKSAKSSLLSSSSARCTNLSCEIGLGGRSIEALIYFWPDSRCFTGESSAEIHLLGSLPIVESLTERITQLGAVPAENGEFTLRSFLAGKIDLTQAEAVLGVIEAESDEQLQQALGQLGGNISTPVRILRDDLLELVSHLEAGLDFVEEDIEFITSEQLENQLQSILKKLDGLALQLQSRGSRSRTPRAVLAGLPNAGKSSLFNAMLGRERVIVSPQAGTTRDAVAESIDLGGLTIELIDTAGIEELHESTPRALAQAMLQAQLKRADVIIYCVDSSMDPDSAVPPNKLLASELSILQSFDSAIVLVRTKKDISTGRSDSHGSTEQPEYTQVNIIDTSINDQTTIDRLKRILMHTVSGSGTSLHSDAMHRTMMRCFQSVQRSREAIARGLSLCGGEGEELVALELRVALDDLSSIIGEVHNEDILGQIFSRFCIGK